MPGTVRTSIPIEKIKAISKYLGIKEQDLTMGSIQGHGVTITTDTANGYLGLKPNKNIDIAVVTGHTVQRVENELTPEHLSNADALIIRNDSVPHVHICLCHNEDIVRIEHAIGRAA